MIVVNQQEEAITFTLDEKLSFEAGQEIDEMISISLDPDIVIQPYDDYVHIRGVILLFGKYHQLHANETPPGTNTNRMGQLIEKVLPLDEKTASFSHRFPIDITVAKERIRHVEDVVMTIDAFDYELPSADTLNVYASLHINGVSPEKQSDDKKEKTDLAKETEKTTEKQPDELVIVETPSSKEEAPTEPKEPSSEADSRSLKLIKDDDSVESSEAAQAPHLSVVDPGEITSSSTDETDETEEAGSTPSSVTESDLTGEKEAPAEETVPTTTDVPEMQIELTEGKEEADSDVKDVTFLTELFEEDEDTYTQMTIYIAQADDSPESIAKRYGMPVLQLLKDNQIAADTIEPGQLIKIKHES